VRRHSGSAAGYELYRRDRVEFREVRGVWLLRVSDVVEADAADRGDCAELLPGVRRLAAAGGELGARRDDGPFAAPPARGDQLANSYSLSGLLVGSGQVPVIRANPVQL
jgi:hypothetical protein